MLRPTSWSRLTAESPAWVGTGTPGSRPRFVAERRRAERGVESLFDGVGLRHSAAQAQVALEVVREILGSLGLRLHRTSLLVKKHGRNLHAGRAGQWTRERMYGTGLYKLSGMICYPKAA